MELFAAHRQEQPTQSNGLSLRAEMREFVAQNGGEVRYDAFANEHLHGEKNGFYKCRLDLRDRNGGGEVPTPTQNEPEYREALASLILSGILAVCEKTGRSLPVVAEVGGGSGALKREILSQAESIGLKLSYISIEPNPNHREAQAVPGTEVRDGTAQKLPLENESVDFLFDEEVLDCLPARVLRWNKQDKVITDELFVQVSGDGLEVAWRPRDPRDDRLDHCEFDLGNSGYDQKYYCYVPSYWDYLKESGRVLKAGGIRFSSDYGYVDSTKRIFREDDLGHVEKAVRHPYLVDLTHFVDFAFLSKLARIQGRFRATPVIPLAEAFAQHSEKAMITGLGRFALMAVR